MAISFNTGTTADGGAGFNASQAITIPAGVLAGDVIVVAFTAFSGNVTETIQASSTGTAPVIIGTSQEAGFGGNFLDGAIFYIVAGAFRRGEGDHRVFRVRGHRQLDRRPRRMDRGI